jgi:hypothetical protein
MLRTVLVGLKMGIIRKTMHGACAVDVAGSFSASWKRLVGLGIVITTFDPLTPI